MIRVRSPALVKSSTVIGVGSALKGEQPGELVWTKECREPREQVFSTGTVFSTRIRIRPGTVCDRDWCFRPGIVFATGHLFDRTLIQIRPGTFATGDVFGRGTYSAGTFFGRGVVCDRDSAFDRGV